ncbi:MAG: hypothetical protein WCA77_06370 [Thermoplasmata archaeon]
MTRIKTVATHDVVRATFPRPVTERDELGMAVGKAIDTAASQFSHEFGLRRKPTTASMVRLATSILDEELKDADLPLAGPDRGTALRQITEVLQAVRKSEIFGLSRPRSRLVVINETVGVYSQPDYWDGRDRFYEMKTYSAHPPPPDVALQLSMFQLAFPGLAGFLICFDRHALPVATRVYPLSPLTPERTEEVLRLAYDVGLAQGTDKVMEYVDSPTVRYTLTPP